MGREAVASDSIAKRSIAKRSIMRASRAVADILADGQTPTLNLEGAAAMMALALSKSALDALGTALMTCNASG